MSPRSREPRAGSRAPPGGPRPRLAQADPDPWRIAAAPAHRELPLSRARLQRCSRRDRRTPLSLRQASRCQPRCSADFPPSGFSLPGPAAGQGSPCYRRHASDYPLAQLARQGYHDLRAPQPDLLPCCLVGHPNLQPLAPQSDRSADPCKRPACHARPCLPSSRKVRRGLYPQRAGSRSQDIPDRDDHAASATVPDSTASTLTGRATCGRVVAVSSTCPSSASPKILLCRS